MCGARNLMLCPIRACLCACVPVCLCACVPVCLCACLCACRSQARDRFLAPDGALFPSHARIYVCPASTDRELGVWDDAVAGCKVPTSLGAPTFGPLRAMARDALVRSSPQRRTLVRCPHRISVPCGRGPG